ncbi:MAG: hypothetical protein ICV66_06030 [Chitinophagaceae bacterium]|nr:hypothetical protein [Chitinophagaceae bacterium]
MKPELLKLSIIILLVITGYSLCGQAIAKADDAGIKINTEITETGDVITEKDEDKI